MKLEIEKQNFTKLFRLTFEGGAVSLRGLLRLEAKSGNPPHSSTHGHDEVYLYIQGHNQDMKKLPKHIWKRVNDYMKDNVPVDKWEIPCLYYLLNTLFTENIRTRNLESDVRYIYDERNKLAHTGDIAISMRDYPPRWSRINQHILNIAKDLDEKESEIIDSLIADLTEGNYDAVASFKSVQAFADLQDTFEELDADLKEAIKDEWSTKEIEYNRRRLKDLIRKLQIAVRPENKELLATQRMEFEMGIHLEIGCNVPEVSRLATQLIGEMFQTPSASDMYRPTFTCYKVFEELQQYIDSMYRTKKVDVKEGSVILILKCKTLRSISDVIASVDDKDLLKHLQGISEAVSDKFKTNITISAYLQEDTVKKTLEKIDQAKSSDITQPKPMHRPSKEICECNIHPGKKIQYYCEGHKVLLCDECIRSGHESCEISKLDKKVANTRIDGSIETMLREIKEKTTQFEGLTEESEKCFDEVAEMEKQHNKYLAEMKKDFEKKLINTEKELKMKLQMGKKHLNDKMDKGDDNIFELEKHAENLEQMKKGSPDKEMIFISEQKVKVISKEADEVKKELVQIKKNKDMLKPFKYEEAMDMTELIDKAEEISVVASGKRSLYNVSAEIYKSLIETESWITGSSFLENEKLVIANAQKPELLIYDEDFEPMEPIVISSQPWEVTPVNYDVIIVTLPQEKKLVRYKISDQYEVLDEIRVDNNCYGVCVVSDAIYVTCHEKDGQAINAEILVLSPDGQNRNVFMTGDVSLKWPRCVRVNRNETKLFVSDWKTDCVHCFSVAEKRALFSYTNIEIKRPMGIYIDEHDHVLVCCGRSDNLYIINKDGKKGKSIRVPELSCPSTITYRNTDGKLVIGMWKTRNACVVYKT